MTDPESAGAALICAPEALLDAKATRRAITSLAKKTPEAAELRKSVAELLTERNETAREMIRAFYVQNPWMTAQVTASYTYLADQLMKLVYTTATKHLHPAPNPTRAEKLSIVGVGGYGRAEMAPFSDIDLLFLTPYKTTAWCECVIESMLYILWDMRLKIGHSVRTVDDCVTLGKTDQTIKTSLLESRHIAGDKRMVTSLQKRLWSKLFKGSDAEYIEQKLEEREARHKRIGGFRYMVEPNVKEGKGGLRDLQTLFWITKHVSQNNSMTDMIAQGYFTHDEIEKFRKAHDFLWTVRCHMHLLSKRPNEKLTFDMQVEVASQLGYLDTDGLRGVEGFMQDYFRQATLVGELTRILLAVLEAQHVKNQPSLGRRLMNVITWNRDEDDGTPDGYVLLNGRLAIEDPDEFLADPINILRLFRTGLRSKILIHPDAMRLLTANLHLIDDNVRRNPEARSMFLGLLLDYGNPERALRRMNELGVLGAFIPEFQRIIAMMQFNNYHHYTVDEHTIQCISVLADIERGVLRESLPILTKILKGGVNRRVLYVALLLHDIGKGLPEDHSIAGARTAAVVAPRLGLNEQETETVVWLVENHLLMSDVAQKRDLSDPRTVGQFAQVVKTTARLNLLTALTVCDIRGVGPNTWNNWKAQLIRELYLTSKSWIKAGVDKSGIYNSVDVAKDDLRATLTQQGWDDAAINVELERHYDPYWQGLHAQNHATFARLLSEMDGNVIASALEPDEVRDATRVCLVIQDHPGLFSRIAGALAMVGANVVDARSYTSSDGYATAIFWIQDSEEKPYEQSRLKRLNDMIRKTLSGEVLAKPALRDRDKFKKRERDFQVPTEITFDNEGSELYSIIEVDTRDRPGLLYDLALTLKANNIYIASAVIATYGAQAVDVFYVKDMFGTKIHNERKQKLIAERLTQAIAEGTEGAMS